MAPQDKYRIEGESIIHLGITNIIYELTETSEKSTFLCKIIIKTLY